VAVGVVWPSTEDGTGSDDAGAHLASIFTTPVDRGWRSLKYQSFVNAPEERMMRGIDYFVVFKQASKDVRV